MTLIFVGVFSFVFVMTFIMAQELIEEATKRNRF
jgi:hypothetical protein